MKLRKIVTIATLTAITLMLIIPIIIYQFPFLVGGESSYTVMSGSMNPALNPGDLIIVKEGETIEVGDIVTVRTEEYIYTHRVVETLEGNLFKLKGDANEEPDPALIEAFQIVGKVTIVFPFSHLYTPIGFSLALIVPASLIIGSQMHRISQFTKRRNRKETMRWRRKRTSMLGTSTLLLALILTVSTTRIIAPHFIGGSSSYFSDIERSEGNLFSGIWEIGANIDIEPDINPDTLNLGSEGQWVTVYIETGNGYDEEDIIVDTVMLDGTIQADKGVVQDECLMVKFDRIAVIGLIPKGVDEVTFTVSGEFTYGTIFTGEDTIRVVDND